jgi:hypothetical protein
LESESVEIEILLLEDEHLSARALSLELPVFDSLHALETLDEVERRYCELVEVQTTVHSATPAETETLRIVSLSLSF